MPTQPPFWKAVRKRLGTPVSKAERGLIESLKLHSDYEKEHDDEDRLEIVSHVAALVEKHRTWFPQFINPAEPQDLDGRWQLLASLTAMHELAHGDANVSAWRPVRTTAHQPTRMGLGDTFVPTPRLIEITFDHRLSLSALVRALKAEWPELRRRGWVRRTRPLGSRALALLRFVCLEAPVAVTWRQRLAIWNAEVEQTNRKWRFPDARRFCAAFRRAEVQLTGERYGLAWFYDPDTVYGRREEKFDGIDRWLVRAARDAMYSRWREEAAIGATTRKSITQRRTQ